MKISSNYSRYIVLLSPNSYFELNWTQARHKNCTKVEAAAHEVRNAIIIYRILKEQNTPVLTVSLPGLASTVVHAIDVMLKDGGKECHGGLEDPDIFKLAFATVDRNDMERRELGGKATGTRGTRVMEWRTEERTDGKEGARFMVS